MKKITIDLDDPNLSDEDRVIKPGITYKRELSPDSLMGKFLTSMVLRQQLRQKFYNGELTLEEINQQLIDAGIERRFHIVSGRLREMEESLV